MARILEKLRLAFTNSKFFQKSAKEKYSKITDSHLASAQKNQSPKSQTDISVISSDDNPLDIQSSNESSENLNTNNNHLSKFRKLSIAKSYISRIDTFFDDWLGTVIISSVSVSALVLGVRELGWLQRWELIAYDQMMVMRPVEEMDKRLVIVKIKEKDIEKYGHPLSDKIINQLLDKIQSHNPKVIGLNIASSGKVDIGNNRNKKNVFVSCTQSSMESQEIPPMSNLPTDNLGFTDIVFDSDKTIRRSLLFANPKSDKKCNTRYSFAAVLAYNYLPRNIEIETINEKKYKLGDTHIPVVKSNSGSYKKLDSGGYQVMLNYRNPNNFAPQVTLTQVLENKIKPNLFKDKLVIVGVVARRIHRGHDTPYTTSEEFSLRTSPVFIHAQTASQLISAVLDGRSFIWYLGDHLEGIWIFAWSVIGSFLVLRLKHPGIIAIASIIIAGGLFIFCYIVFLHSGWIPIVPAAISLLLSIVAMIGYDAYRTQSQSKLIILQVEKQQEAIAQLNTLLKQDKIARDKLSKSDSPNDKEPIQAFSTSSLLSGRYQINRVLGQGGFGCTYLAQDTQRPGNPTCVVKQLMPARRDTKFMQVARRLFDSEAEILEILGRNSQIPELLAFFEENNEFYLIQEFIKGHSLERELSSRNGEHDEKYVVKMLADILKVLAYVHEHRVIHRDIKPSNILRNKQDDTLVLIDFGAVKQIHPSDSEDTELATVAIGTRGYTPPEQFAGHPRLSSDIYAVGMIAIQALTGLPPRIMNANLDTGNIIWHQQANASSNLKAIIDKMVCYHFSDRYQSAAEVLAELKKIT